MVPALIAMLLLQPPQSDSARLVDGRVIVEPVGITIAVPRIWMGLPDPYSSVRSCVVNAARPVPTIITDRSELIRLGAPVNSFNSQFAQVVDSVVPLQSHVAHIGSVAWLAEHQCVGPHVRVYLSSDAPATIHARTAKAVVRVVSGRLLQPPTVQATRDSAGWKVTIVHWNYTASDYGATVEVYFLTREVRNRTLVLALMNVGTTHRETIWGLVRSVTIPP